MYLGAKRHYINTLPFLSGVGPRKHVLDGGSGPPRTTAILRGVSGCPL